MLQFTSNASTAQMAIDLAAKLFSYVVWLFIIEQKSPCHNADLLLRNIFIWSRAYSMHYNSEWRQNYSSNQRNRQKVTPK